MRMLVVWERLTGELGLIMNKEKRSVGTHLVWLGFNILTTPGMLCVTKKKVVKLTVQITAAIDGLLVLADYRSMMGSLEHILFATNRDRLQMLGLWRPLRGAWEPNNRVRLDDTQKEQMRWWLSFIAGAGGVSAVRAVTETLEQRVEEATHGVLTVTSDAYSEPGGQGLGVYMHGLYAWYDVPRHLQGLHITVLEFLAGLLAIKICGRIAEAAEGKVILHIRLDAITTCYSMTKKSEKSWMLQATHLILLQMPEFLAIRRLVAVSHIAGMSNVFADMASRPGKRHLMFKLAAMMGVELAKAEVPVEWLEAVIEELLGLGRETTSNSGGEVRSPVAVIPPGQHADTPHFAALGEEVSNNDNKASRVKLTLGVKEEDARRRARMTKTVDCISKRWNHTSAERHEVKQRRVVKNGEGRREVDADRRAKMARSVELVGGERKTAMPAKQRAKQQEQETEGPRVMSQREFHLTDRMVSALEEDTSRYAIAKTNTMREAIRKSYDLRMFGKNESTQRQQRGQWKHWVRFCEAQGICPTRDDHDANSGRDRMGHMREDLGGRTA